MAIQPAKALHYRSQTVGLIGICLGIQWAQYSPDTAFPAAPIVGLIAIIGYIFFTKQAGAIKQ
jgi:hypothetical protein